MMKRQIWSIELHVKGVAPRCRKTERHYINLSEADDNGAAYAFTDDDLAQAREKLSKFRSYESAYIVAHPEELENDSGVIIRSRAMFSKRRVTDAVSV